MIVLRNTAEMTSAQPATASRTSATGKPMDQAEAGDGRPQTITATITARPWRRTPVHPSGRERADQRAGAGGGVEEADGRAPPPKTVGARAGNRARGMPKTMALMSIR